MRFYKKKFSLETEINCINILSLNIRFLDMISNVKTGFLMNTKNTYILRGKIKSAH